jgi:hypothetical protein
VKNSEKVAAAEKVAQNARQTGFPHACLLFEVPEEEAAYTSLDEVAEGHENEEVNICIHIILDEEFKVEVNAEGGIVPA